MDPDSGKLIRSPAGIDLTIKEVGNAVVVKGDAHGGALLPHQHNVFDAQHVVSGRNPESTDFRVASITQI